MLTGYKTTLPTDTLLSAGVLFCRLADGTIVTLGVTDGAPDFDPGVELGEIMFDNRSPSRLKGLTRRVGFSPIIKGTAKEFGPAVSGGQIARFEPDSGEATVGSVTTVTPKEAGSLIGAGVYVTELRWIFERASGGYACIFAPLALCRKWSKKGSDKKEAQISFEFEAIGDPVNDLGTGPYAIEIRTALPASVIPLAPLLDFAPLSRSLDLSQPLAYVSETGGTGNHQGFIRHNGCGTLGVARVTYAKSADEWNMIAANDAVMANSFSPNSSFGTATQLIDQGPYDNTTAWKVIPNDAGGHNCAANAVWHDGDATDRKSVV